MGTSTALSTPRTLEDFRRSLSRVIQLRQSSMSATAADNQAEFVSKPAARAAVEALERLRYDGTSDDDQSKLTCIFCMEELEIGSRVIRMPCSHMFHEDCILKWLNKSHTCPICRSSLSN